MAQTYWTIVQDVYRTDDTYKLVRRSRLAAPPTPTYHWSEDANCHSLPAEIFEPSLEGRHREENLKVTEERMEQARKACSDCPVWDMCYKEASPNDFFYTMRAGIEPAQFTQYKELEAVRYRSGQASQDAKLCSKGHNNWKMWGKKHPRRKCADCSNERSAQYREKLRAP